LVTPRAPPPQPGSPAPPPGRARSRLRPAEPTASDALLRTIARHGVVRLPSGHWRYRFDPACERTRMPVDCWPLLPRITAPTLVIRGEYSTILEREVARRMAKTLPSAAVEEIPGPHHQVDSKAPRAAGDFTRGWLG